jgi:hypothetical protein
MIFISLLPLERRRDHRVAHVCDLGIGQSSLD